MKSRFCLIMLFFLSVSAAVTAVSFADAVILKSGQKIEGVIISQTEDLLKIKIALGEVSYKKEIIESILEEPDEKDHCELGNGYLNINDYEQALAEFHSALQINSDCQDAQKGIERAQKSIQRKEQETKQGQDKFTELYKNGLEAVTKKDYEKAVIDLEAARRFNPSVSNLNSVLAGAYKKLALEYVKKAEHIKAIGELKKARIVDSSDPEVNELLAGALYALAQDYVKKGAYDEAITLLSQAIKLDPGNTGAHASLGKAYYEKEEMAKAIVEFEKVLKLQPDNKEIKELLQAARLEKETVKEMGLWKSDYFIIDFDSKDEEQKRLVRDALTTLEDAYGSIGNDLYFHPDTKTKVSIFTREQYEKMKGSVKWAVGQYNSGTKEIWISLYDMAKQPKDVILTALWHETAHLFVDLYTQGNCPVWLNEGFAQYEERKKIDIKPWGLLTKAVQEKKLYTLKELEGSFVEIKDENKVAVVYLQSLACVDYLVSKYEIKGLRKVFKELSEGRTIETALQLAVKTDYQTFESECLKYIKEKY